ncbi:MAG: hypothetical protein M1816_007453 [Peltula sp. TS41687]|nr:MAG: hypothetical protein M1816_007453 [Peltula sp. TS41687]
MSTSTSTTAAPPQAAVSTDIHPATDPRPRSPAFIAAPHLNDGKAHLLLAATGSVATIKLPQILGALSRHANLSIRLILTRSATRFLAGQSAEQPALASLRSIRNVDGIYLDEDEWAPAWTRGSAILHIELRRWADLLVVAPLSANSLAKVVGGFCDDLLGAVVRAWDTRGEMMDDGRGEAGGRWKKKKRIVFAPAMNTAMWRHPVTAGQIRVLEEEWGVDAPGPGREEGWVEVLRPVEKRLACGDVGGGAMRDWENVVGVIEERLGLGKGNEP